MSFRPLPFALLMLTALLTACAITNQPINVPLTRGANSDLVVVDADRLTHDDVFIGLAFSGGGTRASSFSYGMLRALQESGPGAYGLLNDVRLVTGVSGGSVTAAWFGYRGPRAVDGYRDYLAKDGEVYMANSPINPVVIARGLSGGANGRNTFARFLDESLFEGATFGDLRRKSNIITWINAADVASQTSFLFAPETFDALCSDLSRLPLSEAVAASAAFPLVFSPIVLEAHTGKCNYHEPDWLTSARHNPEETATLKAYGRIIESYTDAEKVKYVKLLDGGITDNFGTIAFLVARAKAQNPYGPLTAEQAVRVRRMLFLVANAGIQTDPEWTRKLKGPGGVALAMGITGSSMGSATRTAYDALRLTLTDWQKTIVDYRCSLPLPEVMRLRGTLEGWDCSDLKLFVSEVTADGLGAEERDQYDQIPTRLRLEQDQVDLAIKAGRVSTLRDPEFRGFLLSLKENAGAVPTEGARRIEPISN